MDGPAPALRLATPADEPAIDALMKASTAAFFPAFYDPRQTASSIEHIARPDPMLLADGTYFVLVVGGELVGCGGWSRRGRPYMGSAAALDDDRLLDPRTEAAHVRAMFVRPDWSRRGLGRRIIEACEAAARTAGFRRLDLVATLPGVPLYEACGFVATADVADIVLADGVRLPCVAMTKSIAPTI
jgi:GNAT superfamily N-acetyltransferase